MNRSKLLLFGLTIYFLNESVVEASPMGTVMCDIVDIMWGNLGRALAIMAVMMVGASAMFGKVSWGLAVSVALGIGIMFGAGDLAVLMLTGTGTTASNLC